MSIDAETLNQVVNSYLSDVKAVFPIDKVYLYGSYAKGTPKWDSDIDLCFFSDFFEGKDSFEIINSLLTVARKYLDLNFRIPPKQSKS